MEGVEYRSNKETNSKGNTVHIQKKRSDGRSTHSTTLTSTLGESQQESRDSLHYRPDCTG